MHEKLSCVSPVIWLTPGKLGSYVIGAVTANASGYLTPMSHNKFAKIRTWLLPTERVILDGKIAALDEKGRCLGAFKTILTA
jgi:hypothetical protein